MGSFSLIVQPVLIFFFCSLFLPLKDDAQLYVLQSNQVDSINTVGPNDTQTPSNSSELARLIAANYQPAPACEQDYYFFYGNQLRDIRDNSVILNDIPHGIARPIDDGGFVLASGHSQRSYLSRYDDQSRLVYETVIDGRLSPNWDYALSVINGDIHYQSIDLLSGNLGAVEPITQVGGIRSPFDYLHWYGGYVVFEAGAPYHLDVKSKVISKAPFPYLQRPKTSFSPNGKYALLNKEAFHQGGFYDIETNQIIVKHNDAFRPSGFDEGAQTFAIPLRWVNDSCYLSLVGGQNNSGEDFHQIKMLNLEKPDEIHEINIDWSGGNKGTVNNAAGFTRNFRNLTYAGAYHYSQIEKRPHYEPLFYRYVILNYEDSFGNPATPADMLDLTTGKIELFETHYARLFAGYNIARLWISPNQLLYSTSGDLITQGTWLYDVEAKEKKKVTSYTGHRFWSFDNTNFVMFSANNKLYRCKKDGTELTVLEESLNNNISISLFKGASYFDKVR